MSEFELSNEHYNKLMTEYLCSMNVPESSYRWTSETKEDENRETTSSGTANLVRNSDLLKRGHCFNIQPKSYVELIDEYLMGSENDVTNFESTADNIKEKVDQLQAGKYGEDIFNRLMKLQTALSSTIDVLFRCNRNAEDEDEYENESDDVEDEYEEESDENDEDYEEESDEDVSEYCESESESKDDFYKNDQMKLETVKVENDYKIDVLPAGIFSILYILYEFTYSLFSVFI